MPPFAESFERVERDWPVVLIVWDLDQAETLEESLQESPPIRSQPSGKDEPALGNRGSADRGNSDCGELGDELLVPGLLQHDGYDGG